MNLPQSRVTACLHDRPCWPAHARGSRQRRGVKAEAQNGARTCEVHSRPTDIMGLQRSPCLLLPLGTSGICVPDCQELAACPECPEAALDLAHRSGAARRRLAACLHVGSALDWAWRRGYLLGCLHHQLPWPIDPVQPATSLMSSLYATALEKAPGYHCHLQHSDTRESFPALGKENWLAQGHHHSRAPVQVTCPDRAEAWSREQNQSELQWTDFSALKVLPRLGQRPHRHQHGIQAKISVSHHGPAYRDLSKYLVSSR